MSSRFLPILLLLVSPLAADEFWTWHTLDYPVLQTGRWSAVAHARLHLGYGKPAQGRIGPVAKYALTNRVSLIAGYYFGEDHDPYEPHSPWAVSHRPFGGVEAILTNRRWLRLSGRAYVERFFVYDKRDYFRYRTRLRYMTAHKFAPLAMFEPFYDAKGILELRYSGGCRLALSRGRAVEVAYTYDHRRAGTGPARHILSTHYVFGHRP